MDEEPLNSGPGGRVSIFDYSIENHFRAMDTISKLCEEPNIEGLDETDIRRFSSSITFLSKDFVMYVGGSVWALDWCPRVRKNPNSPVKCEFIAVAAHPPESYYHKMGTPLTDRGIVQIWCILNVGVKEEETPLSKKKTKRISQNSEAMEDNPSKRPRLEEDLKKGQLNNLNQI
ncbi:hypothetical protein PTKIN_Ptkin15bG0137500 [Pterospermum kingtungense]